jgi:hypothetical protein
MRCKGEVARLGVLVLMVSIVAGQVTFGESTHHDDALKQARRGTMCADGHVSRARLALPKSRATSTGQAVF